MKRHLFSWLVGLGLLFGLGGYALWLMFGHDWRGRFEPDQLALEAAAYGPSLRVTLRNTTSARMIVYESPVLAAPFEVEFSPAAGGPPVRVTPAEGAAPGRARVLEPGSELCWELPLARLGARLPPGSYRLSLAYDPAAAAERNDPVAEDLTLGRAEAGSIEVKLGTAP